MSQAEKIIETLKKLNITVMTIHDKEYPENLKNIYAPPALLYLKGKIPCFKDITWLAMVGLRNATTYGKKIAERLSYKLASRGIIIVSGMARGIDTAAHKGAIKADKKTVAVLGCGVDVVYPKENNKLMEDIVMNGAIISEYLPGTQPNRPHFPARNRIISGLSDATIVVEAGKRSGALITADFALEQGRDVFAVPGNIDSFASEGTNHLIQQGAKLITCIDDILEELPFMNHKASETLYKDKEKTDNFKYLNLSLDEKAIIDNLSNTPVHINQLCIILNFKVQKVNVLLTTLEMKGLIERIPGNYFILS